MLTVRVIGTSVAILVVMSILVTIGMTSVILTAMLTEMTTDYCYDICCFGGFNNLSSLVMHARLIITRLLVRLLLGMARV